MPLKNYTTRVPARKTVGEIQQLLAEAGARGVAIAYDGERQPESVEFAMEIGGRHLAFRLPANWRAVQAVLKRDGVRTSYQTEEHARNVAWRIVKDWIDAQMAFLRSEQVELPQLFLGHGIHPGTGRTLYEELESGRLGLLPAGDEMPSQP